MMVSLVLYIALLDVAVTPYTCCNGGGGETHNHAVAAVVVLSVLEGGGPLTVTARRQGHVAPDGVVTVAPYVVIVAPPVVEPSALYPPVFAEAANGNLGRVSSLSHLNVFQSVLFIICVKALRLNNKLKRLFFTIMLLIALVYYSQETQKASFLFGASQRVSATIKS